MIGRPEGKVMGIKRVEFDAAHACGGVYGVDWGELSCITDCDRFVMRGRNELRGVLRGGVNAPDCGVMMIERSNGLVLVNVVEENGTVVHGGGELRGGIGDPGETGDLGRGGHSKDGVVM